MTRYKNVLLLNGSEIQFNYDGSKDAYEFKEPITLDLLSKFVSVRQGSKKAVDMLLDI